MEWKLSQVQRRKLTIYSLLCKRKNKDATNLQLKSNTIKKEKKLLEKEWSRVVKSVKGKLYSLEQNGSNAKQTNLKHQQRLRYFRFI